MAVSDDTAQPAGTEAEQDSRGDKAVAGYPDVTLGCRFFAVSLLVSIRVALPKTHMFLYSFESAKFMFMFSLPRA